MASYGGEDNRTEPDTNSSHPGDCAIIAQSID
jgi:hypothetical protein